MPTVKDIIKYYCKHMNILSLCNNTNTMQCHSWNSVLAFSLFILFNFSVLALFAFISSNSAICCLVWVHAYRFINRLGSVLMSTHYA